MDKGRSQKTGGSGLGLAIVKHIVSLYNGNITVKSVEHVGTEIVLHLPLETQGESYNKIVVN